MKFCLKNYLNFLLNLTSFEFLLGRNGNQVLCKIKLSFFFCSFLIIYVYIFIKIKKFKLK